MLQPKRTKFRKVHKMKMKGVAHRGSQLAYGTFGIKANEGAWTVSYTHLDVYKRQDLFAQGEYVDVTGTSKGKGFQGVVKRHNFAGVMQATHGQHNRLRAPGSIGAGSDPVSYTHLDVYKRQLLSSSLTLLAAKTFRISEFGSMSYIFSMIGIGLL